MELEPIGALLRKYRKRAGWSEEQLAQAVGVSHATISRAEISDAPPVRVLRQIIEALGTSEYVDFHRRDLRELAEAYLLTSEQRQEWDARPMIGLLVPAIDKTMFWGQVAGAIEAEATERSYVTLLFQHRNDIDRQNDAFAFFESFDTLQGIISVPALGTAKYSRHQLMEFSSAVANVRRRGVSVIFLDRRVELKIPVPYVGADNEAAAYMAVSHLIRKKHKRIGALFDLPYASPQEERLKGYRRALEEHDLPFQEELIRFGETRSGYTRKSFEARYGYRRGVENARELLRLPADKRPTAIFCATGHLALKVRDAAESADAEREPLRIPEELSVIGFDDLPQLDIGTPHITRVHYDLEELGKRACEVLIALIDGIAKVDDVVPLITDIHIKFPEVQGKPAGSVAGPVAI